MHLCEDHFGDVRDAIKLRGLWDLVVQNPAEALPMVAALNDDADADPDCVTDPLLAAQYLIFQHALKVGGAYLLLANDDGSPLCPICEYVLNVKDADPMQWVNGACDQVLREALEQDMIARPTLQ